MESSTSPGELRLASREALVFWAAGALMLGIVVVLHSATNPR